jgi:hypothetical protein
MGAYPMWISLSSGVLKGKPTFTHYQLDLLGVLAVNELWE